MKIFMDTSSLFKLYHKEKGTEELINLFKNNLIASVYLAEISKIEFASVVWRLCRMQEITEQDANQLLNKFELDYQRFSFIPENSLTIDLARSLIRKYWKTGLRTLDSIQLAQALSTKSDIDLFISADKILLQIAGYEGFETKL